MAHPVNVVHDVESVGVLAKMLVDTEHSAYPVVRFNETTRYDRAVGIITRNELIVLLCDDSVYNVQAEGVIITPEVSYLEVSN